MKKVEMQLAADTVLEKVQMSTFRLIGFISITQ